VATIPDTPAIANALEAVAILPEVTAAVQRLRILHTLGGTVAATEAGLRKQVADLIAERDARPTAAALAEVEAERDSLRAELAALREVKPGVPVAEFKRRLAPFYFALGGFPDAVQKQWDRVLALLDTYTVVYPREEPVAGLIQAARAQNLLTAEQAAALAAEGL